MPIEVKVERAGARKVYIKAKRVSWALERQEPFFLFLTMPRKFRTFFKGYVFLAAASAVLFVLSFYGWRYAEKNVHERSQLQFKEECQTIEALIQNRLELYVNALYGAQALFASSLSVERDEWQV